MMAFAAGGVGCAIDDRNVGTAVASDGGDQGVGGTQPGSGARLNSNVWTGSPELTSVGTPTSTCNNWTGTTGDSPVGSSAGSDGALWNFFSVTSSCAASGLRLYCIER